MEAVSEEMEEVSEETTAVSEGIEAVVSVTGAEDTVLAIGADVVDTVVEDTECNIVKCIYKQII